MKCKLLPLCIPLRGMRQLPCKLESKGLLIVFSQTKAVSKQSRAASDRWLFGLSGLGKRETTAAAAPAAVSPGWSASRLSPGALLWSFSFFLSLRGDCVHVCLCAPMCGPAGYCQADHGSWCELACLSVSTYMLLLSKKRRKKGRRGDVTWGSCNTGMEQQIPQHAGNMAAGGCQPSEIRTRLPFFFFFFK